MLDLDKIRRDTPGCENLAYLHNAGSSLTPQQVFKAEHRHEDFETLVGGYEAAEVQAAQIENTYKSVARLLNAATEEIALVENATIAWQRAFYSMALSFKPGDHILTAEAEYAANYVAFLQIKNRMGVEIEVVPSDSTGQLDVTALEKMIDERVKLIAVTWLPTNGGLANPAAAIGKIARANNIPYLLDACQAVGQMVVDVEALNCDMLSATGRKFLRAPRGTGFLYVRRSMLEKLEPAMIDHYAAEWTGRDEYKLRPDARRFETWEKNYALVCALGAAVDYALDIGMPAIEERCHMLSSHLRHGLADITGVKLRDLGISPSAIVSFTIDGHDASNVVKSARQENIKIGLSQPASTRLDAEARNLPPIIRASPHYYNTKEEIDRLIKHCQTLRSPSPTPL